MACIAQSSCTRIEILCVTSECTKKWMNVEAIAQYQLTLIDTTWTDTDKAFEESPCEQNQELLRENLRVTIDQICMQGLLHWKR